MASPAAPEQQQPEEQLQLPPLPPLITSTAEMAKALEAPNANMFVDLPEEGTLVMCVMRPTVEEVCPELPLLFMPPEPQQLLRPNTHPRMLGPVDMLGEDAGLSVGGGDADEEMARASVGEEVKDLLDKTERLLRQPSVPLPEELARLEPSVWREVFQVADGAQEGHGAPAGSRFNGLGAAELRRLVVAAESAELCDILLGRLPRILAHRTDDPDDRQAGAPPEVTPDGAAARGDDRPLPSAWSDLLRLLLTGGSALSLSASEFEERVVRPMQAVADIGPRAATHAMHVFSACKS